MLLVRGESMTDTITPDRNEMIDFLKSHFRYYTMNSWNKSTSYAQNVKVYNIGLTPEQRDRAYDIICAEGAYDEINCIIDDFGIKHNHEYQIGFNGRSDGYLVLYQGGREDLGFKTQCDSCGKLTWYETEQSCKMKECNGTLKLLDHIVYQTFSQPGMGLDMDNDFEDWDDHSLLCRYKLVKHFDETVDLCISVFKEMVNSCEAVEKEIMVSKKIIVLKCKSEVN